MSNSATERLNAALSGRYAIERELGEGGMATVYLAEDIKHNRKVALRVLKPELAAVVGAERFLAEIQVTANLQHPHILPLFDSGEADSFLFYVMPFVEGETLQDRIDREKQLPVDEAVRIATAVANALQTAHDHGIIHRDIKPANILLSRGEPLIADFGIALAVGAAGGGRLTETGLSLGTPYYMSPEQATGDQAVGSSTDTYALGSVLYEMLVGDPPYAGSTAQAVLGKIIAGEPVSAAKHRPSVPANVEAAIRKALEKLPADRFTSAQEFVRALGDVHFRYGEGVAGTGTGSRRGLWNPLSLGLATAASIAVVVAARAVLRPEVARVPLHVAVQIPEDQRFDGTGGFDASSDGTFIVYQGPSEAGLGQLWMRRWDQLDAVPIAGTEGGALPAISPDGAEVAFQARGFPVREIRITPLAGGTTRTVTDSAWCCVAWGGDGMIYFTDGARGLSRVPSGGGAVESLSPPPPNGLTWAPQVLLAGRRAVQSVYDGSNRIEGINLETGEVVFLADGHDPMVTASGHLLYVTDNRTLMAAPFDPGALEFTGPAAGVATDLLDTADGIGNYAVADATGTLVYRTRPVVGRGLEAVWADGGELQGATPSWSADIDWFGGGVALSPDGTRLAISQVDDRPSVDIWVKQLPTGPHTKLSLTDSVDYRPAWSPDGLSVLFLSNRDGRFKVYRRRADGSSPTELVYEEERDIAEAVWSPDGTWLVYRTDAATPGRGDILAIRPGVDSTPRVLVATDFEERYPSISSDGRWLAYASNESGRFEVFVRPFPITQDRRIPVSQGGGNSPRWSRSGLELFYMAGDQYAFTGLMRARIALEPPFPHEETLVSNDEILGRWSGQEARCSISHRTTGVSSRSGRSARACRRASSSSRTSLRS